MTAAALKRPAIVLTLVLAGWIGVGPAVAQAADDPPRPWLGCLTSAVIPDQPSLCTVRGFRPGVRLEVVVGGTDEVLTRATADRSGAAEVSFAVPPSRRPVYRTIVARQRVGGTEIRATTALAVGMADSLVTTTTTEASAADTASTVETTPTALGEVEPLREPSNSVPLRVSIAVGVGALTLVALAIRRRRQRLVRLGA